jgi:hypothetical protein
MDLIGDLSPVQILLTFVIIMIVYMVVIKGLTSELILGFIVIWTTIFYISSGDKSRCYNKNKRFRNKRFRNKRFRNKNRKYNYIDENSDTSDTSEYDNESDSSYNIDFDINFDSDSNDIYETALDAMKNAKEKFEDKKYVKKILPIEKRPMPLEYTENNYKKNTLPELSGLGDNRLVLLQKHRGNKNREAMDSMARTNKYTNLGYFKRELDNTANSRWWDDESLESEF